MTYASELLHEVSGGGQHANEATRRWFSATGMDLYVWVDEFDRPFKFQLCYEKGSKEYALTWEAEKGFDHALVDAGDGNPAKNNTSILRVDGELDKDFLLKLFQRASANLPSNVGGLVSEALNLYPASPQTLGRRPVPQPPRMTPFNLSFTAENVFWAIIILATLVTAFAWLT